MMLLPGGQHQAAYPSAHHPGPRHPPGGPFYLPRMFGTPPGPSLRAFPPLPAPEHLDPESNEALLTRDQHDDHGAMLHDLGPLDTFECNHFMPSLGLGLPSPQLPFLAGALRFALYVAE